jgi:D-serine deaminase-like pyridoxal phosphate-dependent protein
MDWKPITGLESIPSPGLLVDADRVAGNINAMIDVVGNANVGRLRPHVKTHKMSEVVRMQLDSGITKFKAATIAEAKMIAQAGGPDVLIAYQMVGPNIGRLGQLMEQFPETSFATVTDDIAVAEQLADQIGNLDRPLRLFIDVDCGMHRTGIPLGESLDGLRAKIESLVGVNYAGLHVYDGHIKAVSLDQRQSETTPLIEAVRQYNQSRPSPTIIGSGSPTFTIWAESTDWECSPGTPIFWDHGYGNKYSELPFAIAAALLTRVISKPGGNQICLDLGYKAVAAEVPLAERVLLPAIPDAVMVGQHEEHLVFETEQAAEISIGQEYLAFPRHICPTVALYPSATVVRDGMVTDEIWQVTSRDRSPLL